MGTRVQLPGLLVNNGMRERPTQVCTMDVIEKLSVFGTQLMEKQKLRYNYGLGEAIPSFRKNVFQKRGNPGENLLQMLERRLDNVVFRAGFAPTIPAARQLIVHGHVRVNGQRVNKPSFYGKDTALSFLRKHKSLLTLKHPYRILLLFVPLG